MIITASMLAIHSATDFVVPICVTSNPPVYGQLMSCERTAPQAIMVTFSKQGVEDNYVFKLYSFAI